MTGKWLFILAVNVAAVLAIWWRGIRLGLDLKGGTHLVVRVLTDDSLKAELDDAVSRVRLRLEEKKVPYQGVDTQLDAASGTYRIRLKGVAVEDLDRARKIVDAMLPDFTRDVIGAELVASLPPTRIEAIRDTTVDQALTTIGERVNATGVVEPTIQRLGRRGAQGDRIVIQLPGVDDPERVKRLIGRVAFLELKLVNNGPFANREDALKPHLTPGSAAGMLPADLEIVEGSDDQGTTQYWVVERVAAVTGRDLTSAQVGRDEFGQPAVNFSLNPDGAKKFGDATGRNVGKQLAIVLDSRVHSAPRINSKITDRGTIEGGFSPEEARELSLVLRAGALPAKIQYLEERTVDASLGADSIKKGWVAGLAGLLAIIAGMLIYYRQAGANAIVALAMNAVLLLGALALLRATLTLPGIAGVILTIGMAVDANVLIYEAIRESLRHGVPPRKAVEAGFEQALTTIVDSNLTTILAALALWMLGSQSVRGFGVTLAIGLVISMFTAFYVSKVIFQTRVLSREWKPGEELSI